MATKKTGTLHLEGVPNPRQIEFFKSTARHTAYGGARGGGKSWAMRRKFVLLALRYDGLQLLLLRRTLAQARENHERQLAAELSGHVDYKVSTHEFVFPNGSRIVIGYCDAEADVYQYQGQEYDVIGFEEATQFTPFQMQYLLTSNRSTRQDFSPRAYYTCNPGGVGHDYIKRLFIDRNFAEEEDPNDYLFIPASVYDNTVLMDTNPEYIKSLKSLPPHLRKAHLDGDWNVIEGQYFEEFSIKTHVIEPFDIPPDWKKFRAMDWGYNDPTAVLWFAVSPDKHLYVYRELYQNKMLAREAARRIKELTGFERISYTVASPDMWQKRGVKDAFGGESVAETFTISGVPLIKADNARIAGWQRLRENLADAGDGVPTLQIFNTCTNLIRTLPALYYDEHDHEDVSDRCEDHAPEALRYGVMSRPSPAKTKLEANKVLRFDPFREERKKASGFFSL